MSGTAIHVDVCPECATPSTWHPLDPPGHCPHDHESRVPVRYVPASELAALKQQLAELSAQADKIRLHAWAAHDAAHAASVAYPAYDAVVAAQSLRDELERLAGKDSGS